MKEAQGLEKSYADLKRRILEFKVGVLIFLKISPIRGMMRFDKSDKLSLRYMRPFEILNRVRKVTYQLALLPN